MLSSGNLNGDFFSFEVNKFWLIFSFFISLIPFILLFFFLSLKKDSKNISMSEIKYFDKIVITLLLLNIYFSITYKVGLYAQGQIYDVPIFIKPLIVILNKLDMYILSGLFLISTSFSKRKKLIVIILLIILSISRASIFVFLFLILVYIANGKIKLKIKQLIISIMLIVVMFEYLPTLFEYREVLRKGNDAKNIEIFDNIELNKFIKSKIIGRISSLSSITYFYQNNENVKKTEYQVGNFEYVIEFFRPFYGGIIKENKIGYTYYFTNSYDETAGVDYGIMYGLPSVVLLSYFKGLHILVLNIMFIVLAIYFIINISSYLFGKNYKEFSFVLLFYPIMSGVPSEFGQIILYLIFISFLKILYISYSKSKFLINSNN
jgi:hypothetical protein